MQRHAVKAHGHIPKDHRGSGEPPMAGDSLGNHAAVLQKVPQAALPVPWPTLDGFPNRWLNTGTIISVLLKI